MEEALRRYQLSDEEFLSWQHAFDTHGLAGLRVTRVSYTAGRVQRAPHHGTELQPHQGQTSPMGG
jgi:hypothetical protein